MAGHQLDILVVDDSEGCREVFSLWLGGDHRVETAADGRRALEMLDETVDIVLLDRNMPGPSGEEVAREIAASEFDPHVAMVSSKGIDFDIAEFPIDGYVQKPADSDDLEGLVEQYRGKQAYQAALDEYFSLTAKLATLETNMTDTELAASEEYARLAERVAEKRAEVDEALATARDDWATTFKSCTDGEIANARRPDTRP